MSLCLPNRATRSVFASGLLPSSRSPLPVATGSDGNQTPGGPEWGSLLEWTWKFADTNFLYGRLEAVDRDVYELAFKRQRPEDVAPRRTRIEAATVGFVRDVSLVAEAETGIGADLTLYRFTSELDSVYGAHPVSWHAFLRIRFGSHGGGHGGVMEHSHGM